MCIMVRSWMLNKSMMNEEEVIFHFWSELGDLNLLELAHSFRVFINPLCSSPSPVNGTGVLDLHDVKGCHNYFLTQFLSLYMYDVF
jgi:hypothetical protein